MLNTVRLSSPIHRYRFEKALYHTCRSRGIMGSDVPKRRLNPRLDVPVRNAACMASKAVHQDDGEPIATFPEEISTQHLIPISTKNQSLR
jgi:hypothetical protein